MAGRSESAAEVGRAVGVSHVAVGNLLKGQLPRSELLYALARHFAVSTDYLLGLDDQPEKMNAHRSTLRERLSGDAAIEVIPVLRVIHGELTVEELEKAVETNVREMLLASAQNKPTYMRFAALYLANLHERLKAQSKSVPKGRTSVESVPREEAPAGPVHIPPQVVSVAETLPNVHPGARDRVRDGALRAMRLARGKGSPGTGTAAETTGSTSSPSTGSQSAPRP
jgi:transcriptional regulator with XRE-family HTH domain